MRTILIIINKLFFFVVINLLFAMSLAGQEDTYHLISARWLFDGKQLHENWSVLVKNDLIVDIGPDIKIPSGEVNILSFPGGTVMPGMIEGHSHLLLHPYNETGWNDQVLKESYAERAIRGAIHAEKTVQAGFTTVRDLGSEGAGYTDVGLKEALKKALFQDLE